jgi:hypothetical protein
VTKKNKKIRLFRTLYPEIPLLVIYQRDFANLLRHFSINDQDKKAA